VGILLGLAILGMVYPGETIEIFAEGKNLINRCICTNPGEV